MAHFKCPKAVEFGDLPKTSNGKVKKFALREKEWKGLKPVSIKPDRRAASCRCVSGGACHGRAVVFEGADAEAPILLLAFAGWNDAGNAATFAAKFLLQRLQGQNFAALDPEIFYNFSEQRPHVRFNGGEREIIWPANEFAYASDPQLAQDVIIALGVEPHLQWRRYIDSVLKVIEECGVELVVTLGALLADVAYAKPVRLTGSASDAELARRLHLSRSRYEGPTGIVGGLHDTAASAASPPSASGPTCPTTSPPPRTSRPPWPSSSGCSGCSISARI